jgi:cytochrome c oxidase subunit 3
MSDAPRALREPWPTLQRQEEGVSFGVWVFLASEALFFGGLFLSYLVYRNIYPEPFHIASRETDVSYGTLNTAILMTSSLTMALAARAAAAKLRRMALWCLAATLALGAAFLVVKGLEYREDIVKHLLPGPDFALSPPATQLFFALYWIMTGVHAIHLSVGMGIVFATWWSLKRRRLPLQTPRLEAVALYWHLVDIVWVILLPLLYLIGRAS